MRSAIVIVVALLSGCGAGQTTQVDFAMPFTLSGTYACAQSIEEFCASSATKPQPPCPDFVEPGAIVDHGIPLRWQCGGYAVFRAISADVEWDFIHDNGQLVAVLYSQNSSGFGCQAGPTTLTLPPAACMPVIPPPASLRFSVRLPDG